MGIDEKQGKASSTDYKVVERFQNFTLLELTPSTGRRHQLRVHLYAIGHPIVGDVRYGDKKLQTKYLRLMLHAKSLEFESTNGEIVKIEAGDSISFNDSLEKIVKYSE